MPIHTGLLLPYSYCVWWNMVCALWWSLTLQFCTWLKWQTSAAITTDVFKKDLKEVVENHTIFLLLPVSPLTEPTAPLPVETLHSTAPVPPPQWEETKLLRESEWLWPLWILPVSSENEEVINRRTRTHFTRSAFCLFVCLFFVCFFQTGQLMWGKTKKDYI